MYWNSFPELQALSGELLVPYFGNISKPLLFIFRNIYNNTHTFSFSLKLLTRTLKTERYAFDLVEILSKSKYNCNSDILEVQN